MVEENMQHKKMKLERHVSKSGFYCNNGLNKAERTKGCNMN